MRVFSIWLIFSRWKMAMAKWFRAGFISIRPGNPIHYSEYVVKFRVRNGSVPNRTRKNNILVCEYTETNMSIIMKAMWSYLGAIWL